MRFPIKVNSERLPAWLRRWMPCKGDPRILIDPNASAHSFERHVAALKIGSTWKSTDRGRQRLSDELIGDVASECFRPVVLEVGASAGRTSLDLLDRLGDKFARYYVTDIYFDLKCVTRGGGGCSYFYHPGSGECILSATNWLVVYADVADAVFPFGLVARRLLKRAPRADEPEAVVVSMLHPDLKLRAKADPRIVVKEYSVLDPWPHEPVDIVKVANVLNRTYFDDDTIRRALGNLVRALRPGGRLVLVDNRQTENVSVFAKAATGLVLKRELNGGSDVADLAGGL